MDSEDRFKGMFRVSSARLRTWDYSWPWWYYVTIVVGDRRCVFGTVRRGHVEPSALGQAAVSFWREIPLHHRHVELDEHIVMPNHVHGIIVLHHRDEEDKPDRRDVQLNVSTVNPFFSNISPPSGSLSVVIRTFKAAVTTWARENGFRTFKWQERFHDHIIRGENDLRRIREYITLNPVRWSLDAENPDTASQ